MFEFARQVPHAWLDAENVVMMTMMIIMMRVMTYDAAESGSEF